MIAYRHDPPVDELLQAIDIVRRGRISEDRALFAKYVWEVQGYVQYVTLGEPGQPAPLMAVTSEADVFYQIVSNSADTQAMRTMPVGAIPWKMILGWLVNKLLDELK